MYAKDDIVLKKPFEDEELGRDKAELLLWLLLPRPCDMCEDEQFLMLIDDGLASIASEVLSAK